MTVLLCEELKRPGSGLDLEAVEEWLAERAPGLRVRRAAGPCARPEQWLDQGLKGAARLVLGVCRLNGDRQELDAQARRLGLDPFGIEVVALGTHGPPAHPPPLGTERAKLLLRAAVAKAQAYQGSRPENAKPILRWGQEVSRRSLFTLPPIRYEAVPWIREAACAAGRGCRICATVCPHGALTPSDDGRLVLNKAPCAGCGACVSVCPRTAFDFPGASLPQIEAQVAVLLDPARGNLDARGILLVCHRSAPALQELGRRGLSYPAGWLPVALPCTGMVTPTWVLQCLNQGAAAVGVLPCPEGECRFGQRDVMAGRLDYCRELLRWVGGAPDSVRTLDPADPAKLSRALAFLPGPAVGSGADHLPPAPRFAPGEAARAILGLAEHHGLRADGTLAHPHSPLGVIEIEDGCTGCGACVSACPSDALAMERVEDAVSLSFDARRCVGCGACIPVCPERVVRLLKVTDLPRLSEGKRVLYRDREVRCERCGAPVAPRAMLDRIRAVLGSDPTLPTITRYCVACRGTLL